MQDYTASAAWVIQCRQTKKEMRRKGSNCVFIRKNDYGIYTILVAAQQLCEIHDIRSGSLILACDNDAGLQHSIEYSSRPPTRFKSFDILWAIRNIRKKLPIKVIQRKVRGHSDRFSRQQDIFEMLNCEKDIKAKNFCRYQKQVPICAPAFYENQDWKLVIQVRYITENIECAIKDQIHGEAMKQFLTQEKKEVTNEMFEPIDWIAMKKANATITKTRYIWFVKYVSGFLPTANHMYNRKEWDSLLCHLCRRVIQNSAHLTQCMEIEAISNRETVVFELHEWMETMKTSPHIRRTLIYTILHAAIDKDRRGRANFSRGRISKRWAIAQHKYFEESQTRINQHRGTFWASRVIVHIAEMVFKLWEFRNGV